MFAANAPCPMYGDCTKNIVVINHTPTIKTVCQNFNTVIRNVYCKLVRVLSIPVASDQIPLSPSNSHDKPLKYTEYINVCAKSENVTTNNKRVISRLSMYKKSILPNNKTNEHSIIKTILTKIGNSLLKNTFPSHHFEVNNCGWSNNHSTSVGATKIKYM